MSIVRAVIYFQLIHLIAGLSVDHCDKLYKDEYKCLFNVSSTNSQIGVECGTQRLEIQSLDPNNGNPFDEDGIPSQRRLWDMCMNSHNGTTVKKRPVPIYYFRSWLNVGIEHIPANYFCDGEALIDVDISDNKLNDTRKLGFSPLAQCHIQCSQRVWFLTGIANVFEKVFNNSFCGLNDLKKLTLNDNKIKELERDAFINLKSLTSLKLQNNSISVLPPDVFREQQNTIEFLFLSNNRLNSQSIMELKNLEQLIWLYLDNNVIDVLPNDIFKHMTQLIELHLGDNLIKALPGSLTNLISLEWLSLSANNISVIRSEDFQNMVNLLEIDFSNNPITTVEPDFCANCDQMAHVSIANASLRNVPKFISKALQLKTLDLSNNIIDQIDVGAFDAGEDIDIIDLSFNLLTDITNVFTNCTVKHLILDNNRLTNFSFTDFSSNLINLSITHNNIHTIDTSHDIRNKKWWSLKLLNLSHNHLNELKDLNVPQSVSTLDVRNNNISFISYNATFAYSLRMRLNRIEWHLENNAFVTICPLHVVVGQQKLRYYFRGNPLSCSCHNQWLRRPHKNRCKASTNIAIDDLNKLTCKHEFQRLGQQSRLITSLDNRDFLCGSNSKCACDKDWCGQSINDKACNLNCPLQCQCYSTHDANHIHLDCSDISIDTLPLTPVHFHSSSKLFVYLDNNSISAIHSNSFNGLNGTIELYLNWTGLRKIADGSFDHLTVLNVLNLEHNNLRRISQNMFKNLHSLKRLFLSHNKIKTIEPNALPSQLQTLHLDNNRLVNYSVWQLDSLTKLRELSVHANQWSCECNFIEKFHKWLQKHSKKVEKTDNLLCVQSNNIELQLSSMTFNASQCYNIDGAS